MKGRATLRMWFAECGTRVPRFGRHAPCALLTLLAAVTAFGAQPGTPEPLPEGTVLEGLDGRFLRADANDVWLFELAEDVNDVHGRVAAGARLRLLPCATLEMLIADVNDRYTPSYRLSALVTKYERGNFLLPTYYLPLSRLKDANSPAPAEEEQRVSVQLDEADGELVIPPDVIEKLQSRPAARGPQRRAKPIEAGGPPRPLGRMLLNRMGRIDISEKEPIFVPDALGWNVSRGTYRLLPCTILEQARQRQAGLPEPIRFNVTGLVTEFRGSKCLLLQRAVPAYGHGNFGR